MTLTYIHEPPGSEKTETAERLRGWDDSSPYHKNRAKRGPRGSSVLRLVEKDINFRNIPEIKEVTIASYVPRALKDPDHLLVARTALQAITGTVPEVTKTRTNVQQWGIKKGERAGMKATLYGNAAYEFLDRCIHLVFPRIKEWKGIKGARCLGEYQGLGPREALTGKQGAREIAPETFPGASTPRTCSCFRR
jgi:large subunit ribosomal protein L5